MGDVLDGAPLGNDNEKLREPWVLYAQMVIDTGDVIPEAMIDSFIRREILPNIGIAELRLAIRVAENAQQVPATKEGMVVRVRYSVANLSCGKPPTARNPLRKM